MSILTLQEYKDFKGINSTTDDAKRTKLIDAVNAQIVAYCNRTFNDYYTVDKTEYFSSLDCELYPSEYPLQSITSIKVSTDAGENYDTTLDLYTDYVIQDSRIVAIGNYFVSTSYPINAIQIIYKGGLAAIPQELALAAVNLVDYYDKEEYTPSKAFAGVQVENITGINNAKMPPHIRRVLEFYRAIEF